MNSNFPLLNFPLLIEDDNGYKRVRGKSIVRAFSVVLVLSISACGDSNPGEAESPQAAPSPNTPSPNNGNAQVSDSDLSSTVSTNIAIVASGTEPRRSLSASGSAVRLLRVDANISTRFSTNDNVMESQASANFDLRTELAGNNTDVTLDIVPVLNRMDPAFQPSITSIPGAWNRIYNSQGEMVDFTTSDSSGVFNFNTDGIFTVSGLMLAVPSEPVGAGANWYFDVEDNGVVLRTRVTIVDIDDNEINTSARTFLLSASNEQMNSYVATSTSSHSTDTLLVSSMDVTKSVSFTATQNVNNQPATILGSWQRTETIRENSQ